MSRPTLSLKAALSHVTLWIGVILVIMALAFGFGASVELRRASLLSEGAVETMATAVDRDRTRRTNGSSTQRYDYTIIYSYRDQSGTQHGAVRSVSSAEYSDFTAGAQIPLRYAAADPEIWELEAGDRDWGSKGLIIGTVVLIAVALACFWAFARSLSRLRRAATQGQSMTAQVMEHRRSGKGKSGRAHLVWSAATGASPLTGTTRPLKRESLPPLGSEITIWVDPRSGRGFWDGEL